MTDDEITSLAEDYIAREEAAHRRFQDALPTIVDLVAPLWHLGDGYGGYVLRCIAEQFEPPPPPPKKKTAIPSRTRKRVFERDGYRCVFCGGWEDLTVDHIHPESLGGPSTFDNLQTACRPCNSAKGTGVL